MFGPDRPASVSRELTKLFEENQRGPLSELIAYFAQKTIKGELVVCVQGRDPKKGGKSRRGEMPEEDPADEQGEPDEADDTDE